MSRLETLNQQLKYETLEVLDDCLDLHVIGSDFVEGALDFVVHQHLQVVQSLDYQVLFGLQIRGYELKESLELSYKGNLALKLDLIDVEEVWHVVLILQNHIL